MQGEQHRVSNTEAQLQRILEHQERLSEMERANQQKAKELLERETHLNERVVLLDQKLASLEARQHAQKMASQSKASLLAPILLLTCIGAGYLAYEQIDQQRQYFQQVKAAEAHVDKLSRVLGLTHETMRERSQEAATKDQALAQANTRIEELEQELIELRNSQSSTEPLNDADNPQSIEDPETGTETEAEAVPN